MFNDASDMIHTPFRVTVGVGPCEEQGSVARLSTVLVPDSENNGSQQGDRGMLVSAHGWHQLGSGP